MNFFFYNTTPFLCQLNFTIFTIVINSPNSFYIEDTAVKGSTTLPHNSSESGVEGYKKVQSLFHRSRKELNILSIHANL